MTRRLVPMVIVLIFLAMLSACATGPSSSTSLYDRLGGKKAIAMVVNDFIDTVGSDTRIQNAMVADRLAQIDVGELKNLVTDQVCMATGGPCTYQGRDMKTAHVGLEITDAEFDYVVDDLVKTLDKYKVSEREQQELLSLLAPMRPDIVQAL